MPPSQTPFAVQCPKCGRRFDVAGILRGKTVGCPNARCRASFLANPAEADSGQVRVRCASCGAHLKAPPEWVEQFGDCPKCKRRVRFVNAESAEKEFSIRQADGAGQGKKDAILMAGEARRSTSTMKELNEAAKDSYANALLKSLLYPFRILGALFFFVLGVPFAVLMTQVIGHPVLDAFGKKGDSGSAIVQHAVAALFILGPLAMGSFFCSFLLGIVRNSAKGGTSAPVAQGAAHRSNLLAVLAWMAMYFGLAILAGFLGRAEGQAFAFSGFCWFFLLLGSLSAPMGLLCTATVSVSGGLHLPRVLKAMSRAPGPYFAAWLVTGLGAGIYGSLMYLFSRWSAEAEGAAAHAWNFCAFLLLPMPLVTMARAAGVFGDYQRRRMPFHIDPFADAKASGLPLLLALGGILLLFPPVLSGTRLFAEKSAQGRVCLAQIDRIASLIKGSSVFREQRIQTHMLQSREQLLDLVRDPKLLRCPLPPEEVAQLPRSRDLEATEGDPHGDDFYVVVRVPESGFWSNAIVLYEKVSTYGNAGEAEGTGTVNAINMVGDVKTMNLGKAQRLRDIAEDAFKNSRGDYNDERLAHYRRELGGLRVELNPLEAF